MAQGNKGNVRFARIRGRIVPIRVKEGVKRETRAASAIAATGVRTGALASIAGLGAAGLGGLFLAGRVERGSQRRFRIADKLKARSTQPLFDGAKAANIAKAGGRLNRLAKTLKFGAKYGVGGLIATQIASIDRGTSADERARFANLGNGGTNAQGRIDPLRFAMLGAAAYGYMRFGKRFEKFGLRGGKFPWKLRDI